MKKKKKKKQLTECGVFKEFYNIDKSNAKVTQPFSILPFPDFRSLDL